jgi:hypothetical protein
MQATAVRQTKGALISKSISPVRRCDTSDSEGSTFLKASLVFQTSREDYDKMSGQPTASHFFEDSYEDSFSECEFSTSEDWLDEYGYYVSTQSRDREGDFQDHRRLAYTNQGCQYRQSNQKLVPSYDDYVTDDRGYGNNRSRDNQYHVTRPRQLLVDEKDIVYRNAHAWEETWQQLVENGMNYNTVDNRQPLHSDRSARDRWHNCLRDKHHQTPQPHRPRSVLQPAASHVPARPSKNSLSNAVTHIMPPTRPRPSAGAPAAPRAVAPAAPRAAAPAGGDQVLLRQAFAAAVSERRSLARAWRLERAADGECC